MMVVLAIVLPLASGVVLSPPRTNGKGNSSFTSVAAFSGGGAYRTDDGWESFTKVIDGEVFRLSFVDSVTGFAAGSAIWRTTDGGQHWSKVFSYPNATFMGLAACSETTAWATAVVLDGKGLEAAFTARTVDGVTWKVQESSTAHAFLGPKPTATNSMTVFASIMYVDKSPGMPVATIVRSEDCGATWVGTYNFTNPPPSNFFLQNAFDLGVHFEDSARGVFTGWFREVEIPNTATASSCSLRSATATQGAWQQPGATGNKTTGSGAVLLSSDGGTPSSVVMPPVQAVTLNTTCGTTLYDVAFVEHTGEYGTEHKTSMFIAGAAFISRIDHTGFLLRSLDGGMTYDNVFNTTLSNLHRIAFDGSGTYGCAAGTFIPYEEAQRYGRLACSTDGGTTWVHVDHTFSFPKADGAGLWAECDVVVL